MDFHQNTFTILVFACLFASIVPVSGVSIIMNSHTINSGEPIQVSISDLHDGSTFEMVTEGIYPVIPGKTLHFQLSHFTLPFSLNQGEISIFTSNTRNVSFGVENAETIASIKASTEDGTFSKKEYVTIPSGTYSSISLEASPLSIYKPVQTTFSLKGFKKGANNANLSFLIDGIENGQVHLTIKVDNIPQVDEIITIGTSGSPLAIVSTSDGTAIVIGSNHSSLQPLYNTPKNLPHGWYALSQVYQFIGADSNPTGTTLSIQIFGDISTDPQKNTLFIARSTNGSWVMMPSSIYEDASGTFISTSVQQDGEYCVVSLGVPENNSNGLKLPILGIIPLIAVLIVGLILIRRRR